jgi:glycosyl transferase family 25
MNFYDYIDRIIYINLDSRKDRENKLLEHLYSYGIPKSKIERFPAIKHEKGDIGCSMSHLKVIENAIDKSYNNILVLEDDFEFSLSKNEINDIFNNFFQKFNSRFDVLQLTYWYTCIVKKTKIENFFKVTKCDTTSGYLVNKRFFYKLKKNFEDGLKNLILTREQTINHYNQYNIDEYMNILQNNSIWLVHIPFIGHQIESFSDIRNEYTSQIKDRTNIIYL